MRTCVSCGTEFESDNIRRTKCTKDCGRKTQSANMARTLRRTLTTFIGVDGEGVTRDDGTHDYVLLSVGNESLYRSDGKALHWREIFPFLYERFEEDSHAAYVGFFLGYDFTQWFRSLPESRARSLLSPDGIAARSRKQSGGNPTPFPVHVGEWEWEIDILGNKRFKLRPGTGFPPGTPGIKNTREWMAICDVGSFFQMSFLSLLNDERGKLLSDTEFDVIAEGKARRSDATFDKEMIRYNILENEILSRVMAQLNDGFRAIGIPLRKDRWFGPGQAAQAWMKQIGAPTGEEVREKVPERFREAARKSYFGGWFEIFAHGHVPGLSYEYDINSAYPYIISQLPCLMHGKWSHGKRTKVISGNKTLRLMHGIAQGSNRHVGTLPYRTPKGRVLRPLKTAGWYWEHEIAAAINAGMIDTFTVDEYVAYNPCGCPPPFKEIATLYQERIKVGKNSSHGKAYKLIYNSSYGKMAQSIGNPTFANPIYASLITAGCRTMIIDAIASHPNGLHDLLMVATDGVYFRTPHPHLPLHRETLGLWDEKVKENLTLFMPGIYWDDTTRKNIRDGNNPKLKSRGISASDLANCIDQLDEKFRNLMAFAPEWPSIELPVKFNMVTAVQALARGKWETCGRISTTGFRTIDSNPFTKRAHTILNWNEEERILRSYAWTHQDPLESTPYEKLFGDEMRAFMLEDMEMPDGSATVIFAEMLGLK